MSKNLQLKVLLKVVDQASRPFKAIQSASQSLTGDIRNTQSSIKALDAQAAKIEGFRKANAQLAVTGQALKSQSRCRGISHCIEKHRETHRATSPADGGCQTRSH